MIQTFGNLRRAIEIRLKRTERLIEIDFDDGNSFQLPAELLRVESPSAEVQTHDPRRKTIVPGKRHVGISSIEPIGTYALRIRFDDGHDTGLYTWDWLYNLGKNQEQIWRTYLDALAERGLSRDPAPRRPPAKEP